MASQPTIVTGRRRQHELLRSWSGWPLTSILIDPAEVAHAREGGWSGTHHHEPETGERIVGRINRANLPSLGCSRNCRREPR